MNTPYAIVYMSEDNGTVSAYVPDLPGLYAAADSRREAEGAIRELIADYFADLEAQGKPAPAARSQVGFVRVAAGRGVKRVALVSAAGALLGQRTSVAKAAAARANGARGGRPRKAAQARHR
jgi:predicted RNase H-like HicB family nuclease